MIDEKRRRTLRTRVGATAAAVVLGMAGIGAAGCGDDEEGPLEDAGKAIDEGVSDATDAGSEAIDDVTDSEAAQDAASTAEEAGNDAADAAEDAVNDATDGE